MKAVFVALPAFERHRVDYLDDDAYRALQNFLLKHPVAGDPIPDAWGIAQVAVRRCTPRQRQARRPSDHLLLVGFGAAVWLFTVYDKDEMADLTARQRKALKAMIKAELEARRKA